MNPDTERPNRARGVHQVLLPLMACGLTLGALELGIAIFHPIAFSFETNRCFGADPYTG